MFLNKLKQTVQDEFLKQFAQRGEKADSGLLASGGSWIFAGFADVDDFRHLPDAWKKVQLQAPVEDATQGKVDFDGELFKDQVEYSVKPFMFLEYLNA